jgi:hypothetical protein
MTNRYFTSIALSLFAAFIFGAASAAAAPRVVSINYYAESLGAQMKCPQTVKFKGSIMMDGPGTVKYTFLRSDGASSPVHTLNFSEAGSKDVSNTWALGKSYAGYQKLKILSPNVWETDAANFDLRCSGGLLNVPIGPIFPVNTSVNISCPIETARTEMVTSLSDGWWQTPQLGHLVSVGIQPVGGQQTMICRYSAYGTQVSVMKKFPAGKTCQVTGSNRFTCH